MIDSFYFIFNSSKSNILFMIRPYSMPTIFPMKKAPREGKWHSDYQKVPPSLHKSKKPNGGLLFSQYP
jgi:ribosomal protein L24E